VAGGATASDLRGACLAGDAAACVELRSGLAARWARGEVGLGPREAWRGVELLAWQDPAGLAALGEILAAGDGCGAAPGCDPEPTPAPASLPGFRGRSAWVVPQTVAVTVPGAVDGWPRGEEVGDVRDPAAWAAAIELGAPLWSTPIAPSAAVKVPAVHGQPGARVVGALAEPPPGDWTVTSYPLVHEAVVVVDAAGQPVSGATVFGGAITTTDAEGVAEVAAGAPVVAVHGDAAGALGSGAFRLSLVAGARPRCVVDDGEPVYCDALRTALPEHLRTAPLAWEGADAGGPWRLRAVAGPPRDDTALALVDAQGDPTWLPLRNHVPDASGVLVVRGGEVPRADGVRLERDGSRLVVRGPPGGVAAAPSTPPRPDGVAAALRAAGLAEVAIEGTFPGGGYARDPRGARLVVAYADADTAVIGTWDDPGPVPRSRLVVEVP
jgi:hypothetical protein